MSKHSGCTTKRQLKFPNRGSWWVRSAGRETAGRETVRRETVRREMADRDGEPCRKSSGGPSILD